MEVPEESIGRLLVAVAEFVEGMNKDKEVARKELEEARAEAERLRAEQGEVIQPDYDRQREKDIMDRPLQPLSLAGSWFHRLQGEEVVMQGSVVGEVQPGHYLVEVHDPADGKGKHQRIIPIKVMMESDANDEWLFHDNDEWMGAADEREKVRQEAHAKGVI